MESTGMLIVSGPIVRRVDQSSASVFVVTRHPREVELTIYANNDGKTGKEILRGKRKTIALGTNLHAVVVTAHGDNALAWGASYHYDLTFTGDGSTQSLLDDGVLVASQSATPLERLIYEKQDRPGFMLPPADPAGMRVLHGSCRKPHGHGDDALARVDELIADALTNSSSLRPQQLFLTGDQIYADDVDPALLSSLRAFAHSTIGRTEEDTDLKAEAQGGQLDPGQRQPLCSRAKLSTKEGASHLITLGEFYAMYSSVWSLEPWRSSAAGEAARGALHEFTARLPFVRRALANIATYMVLDDHEVTDDWYIRETWCDAVLDIDNSLGRRIVRNGLAAYAVFQHWGNDPDQATPDQPLGRALAAIDGWNGTAATVGNLDNLLPVPKRGADLASPSPERLSLSWRWRSPAYEVIGLDTRTRRQFAPNHVSLLSAAEIDRVLDVDSSPPPFTIVISAAPVLGVQLLEQVQNLVAHVGGANWLDVEPWAKGKTYEHLLTRLLARTPVIVLSGDVHYGFGASLFEQKNPSTRIVNFVSSAIKNMPSGFLRLALSTLGLFTDNHLSFVAMPAPPAGVPLVLDTKSERTIAGQTYEEEVMVDGDALGVGAQLAVALNDSLRRDRTDITGYCNMGELRIRTDKNQAIHAVWHKKRDEWRQTEHTALFKINRTPDVNTKDVTHEFVGSTFYAAFADHAITRYMSWTSGLKAMSDNRKWGAWSPKRDTPLTIEKVGELCYLKQGTLYLSWSQGHKDLSDGRKWAVWSPEKDTPITITRHDVTGLYFLRNKERGFSVLSWSNGFGKPLGDDRKWSVWTDVEDTPITIMR